MSQRIVFVFIVLMISASVLAQPDPARTKYERVATILKALQLSPGENVADIGAADGYYTVHIARAVGPLGRVTAVDVSEPIVDELRRRVQQEGVTNVDVTLAAADDLRLPPATYDVALIYNTYHDMSQHRAVLQGILSGLKTGGRLVVIEPVHDAMRTASREKQGAKHEISDIITAEELQAAGFSIARRDPTFRTFVDGEGSGAWWLIVATKPTPTR